MTKDRFTQRLWISAGIIVASIVIALLLSNYFASDLATEASAIVNDRITIQQKTDSVENLADLEQQEPQAAQYQAEISQLFPDQYGLVNFPQWFAQQGNQFGLTANAEVQDSTNQAQGANPGTAQFSFDAEGTLAGITSFMDAISTKSSGFLLTLTSFTMTNDGTNEKITGSGTLFLR